jgi:hypothetical protein
LPYDSIWSTRDDHFGHDAEFLERQLIDCVPYYPKPDIENAEIP